MLTFPALLAAGLPPVLANTTSTVALCVGMPGGVWAFRRHLVGLGGWIWPLGVVSVLGGMAGGKVAFDAAGAAAAKAALVDGAAKIAVVFEKAGTDPESKAKPEIWTNWDDFLAKGKGLGDAAAALDATTLEGVQAGMDGVGGACKACHTAYRM